MKERVRRTGGGQAQGLPLQGVWLVGAFEGDAGLGTHKGCPYGDLVGLAGRGLSELFRLGTCYEYRHQVG